MPAASDAISRSNQRNAVLAGFLGWTLDAFDFFVLTFVFAPMAKEFGCSIADIALTLTASLATRWLGAIFFGLLADRYGRRIPLIVNVGDGAWRVVLLLAIVMVSDTLAFFAGRAFGRRRLAPALSPGKTVEGALGGLVGGVSGAFGVRALGLPILPPWHTLVLGLLVAALGIVGDLDESLLKRWAGVKDSGTLFPGHGGMLDRLDALLFGAPILYYYFLYVS